MKFDVAIVGCGPVGALLANLLGQAGVSVVVIEREAAIYPLPRAIHFDGEVMRIFQSAGLCDAVEAITRPGLHGMRFVNASGETLLTRGGSALIGPHACANNHYFHQPELEAVLRAGLQRFSHVTVLAQHEVTALADTHDEVALTLQDLRSPQAGAGQGVSTVHARFAIGCDGARSLVRKTMGSPNRDLGLHQPWLVFDAILNEDQADLPQLPSHTVQHCDPARPMTYCNVTGRRRRWEIMLMPGDDEAQLLRHETLWALIARWLKPGQATIERAAIYTFHSVITEGWRGGQHGRLLLAGDSCHQAPPFLGQGMCAGMRDAANLAWKLALVLRGQAGDALLDTYEAERAHHVEAFVKLAVRLGDIIQTTDTALAEERDRKFLTGKPEIFEFPAPGLGPGLVARLGGQGAGLPVGQTFPQPRLSNGQLLDEVLGRRFAVLAEPGLLDAASAACKATWQHFDVMALPAADPPLSEWLLQHGVKAVMLRPDRYILGMARNTDELEQLATCLRRYQ